MRNGGEFGGDGTTDDGVLSVGAWRQPRGGTPVAGEPDPSGGAREALALLARIEARLERRETAERGGAGRPGEDVAALGAAVAALGERIAALEEELASARSLLEAIVHRGDGAPDPSPPARPFPRDLFRIATQPVPRAEAVPRDDVPRDDVPPSILDGPREAARTTGLPARLWPE